MVGAKVEERGTSPRATQEPHHVPMAILVVRVLWWQFNPPFVLRVSKHERGHLQSRTEQESNRFCQSLDLQW